jgi:glycosyltransferase involved in cell wall biosynthesis
MACGCTVVVSDIGALPELVGEGGVLVRPGKVEDLVSTLESLINDKQRRKALGDVAQRRAREVLSLERQAALLDVLFRDLLATHH